MAKSKMDLETLLGYSFNEPELMERAVSREGTGNRAGARVANDPGLRALGEAAICFAVVNHLYSQGMGPGQIDEERAARVRRENYARVAEEIGLGDCLMPSGQLRGSSLGERFEQVMGAVYLDDVNAGGTGIGACWEVLRKINII